jgi:hypothetical protein
MSRTTCENKSSLTAALFWDITQRGVVIPLRRFGKTITPMQSGQLSLVAPNYSPVSCRLLAFRPACIVVL